MDPAKFWSEEVIPAIDDWSRKRGMVRLARNALIAFDNLAEHYINFRTPGLKHVAPERDALVAAEPILGIARDIHDAHKHGYLRRTSAIIKTPPAVREAVWTCGSAPFGTLPFGGIEIELWITYGAGKNYALSTVIDTCVRFWCAELESAGLVAAGERQRVPPILSPFSFP